MAMPRARLKSKANDDHRTDSEICDDLEKLTRKKLQGREVETVRAAIQRLERLAEINDDCRTDSEICDDLGKKSDRCYSARAKA
jgi:hypothetical protein